MYMRKPILLYILMSLLLCGMGSPEESPEVEVSFTEIIIKVDPEVIIIPEGAQTAPVGEIEINSDELKGLNRQFNLVSLERVFRVKKAKDEAGEEYQQKEISMAPEGEETPDLENIFLLKFPELIAAQVIIDEYNKLDEVIYAEENRTFSIF